jgi:hypothetical protein
MALKDLVDFDKEMATAEAQLRVKLGKEFMIDEFSIEVQARAVSSDGEAVVIKMPIGIVTGVDTDTPKLVKMMQVQNPPAKVAPAVKEG